MGLSLDVSQKLGTGIRALLELRVGVGPWAGARAGPEILVTYHVLIRIQVTF